MLSRLSKCLRLLNCCKKVRRNNYNINNNNNVNNNVNNNDNNNYNNINEISYLNNINYKDANVFIPPIKWAKVVKVYDGDTITIASRLPFEGSPIYRFRVRLAGIDSAEMRGGSHNETEIAIVARDALHKLIFGKIIELRNNKTEKYGRILADLYINNLHINKWMIDNKYAVNYSGKTKNRPIEWE